MYRAWWCGGPFIVPFFDTVFTLCFEVYVSTFWLKGIFTTKGVAKIPNVIRQNWVAPANALGSFWLPVVYCASFAILALHVSRMIIAAKHARNPFHPGIMHFIFGFSILAILAFAGVCKILMASFAIFGELVIIWSCLGTCVFGPHLLACDSVAVAGCGPCGPCGPTVCAVGTGCAPACSPTAIACVPGGPAGCTVENGPCCSSPAPVVINAAVPVPTCHPSGPNIGPVGGGSASAVAPASKTATHTSHSNPFHASAPLDSETQQKLAVENPVANTCQISINTGTPCSIGASGVLVFVTLDA
ncbi:hypothetical protein CSUI_002283 [Cystoisospora suis]|uniref:Transmembrane protein n=1 Tax=Cystoisospora suis TaxID=483139 RepID=A0A2C6L9G5_9APIC|nr:hypothetical protein CSUI_002283 [Cystoisospora suis]